MPNDGRKLGEREGLGGEGGGELSRAKERWRSRWTGWEESLRARECQRAGMDGGTHGMMEREERTDGWMRRRVEAEGGREEGFVRSQLQKAKAGEETGCRGEGITELNVWAD